MLNDDKVQLTGFIECLDRKYKELPNILKAICYTACAAVWTGVGLAACAGCLAGLGINC